MTALAIAFWYIARCIPGVKACDVCFRVIEGKAVPGFSRFGYRRCWACECCAKEEP